MNALTITDFSFSYPKQSEILSDVSMELASGSFNLLVGATGCGKTTLLRSIKPELAPVGSTTGAIEVFGRRTTQLDPYESATMIGYVSQSADNQIVCDSVWHELAFGLENLGIDTEQMRRRLAEVAYFFGIDPWIHAPIATLSGGQKQIVTLASILVMQPKLLLLDEPTSQLDPIAEKNFLHALFRINRELGITILVATHSPETMVSYATDAFRIQNAHVAPISLDSFIYSNAIQTGSGGRATDPDHFNRSSVISLRDGYFRYEKDADWVLRGCDIEISPASIHAIIGGNGSGKSTILQLITGVLKPQRGRVGNDFREAQAYLAQDPKALFVCDSIEEELGEWQDRCGYSASDIAETAQRFGLDRLLSRHPYDLSGGQQQKLAMAKLLLTEPRLLLLDEPTKGLDAESKCELVQTLLDLRTAGTTIVLVTHDLGFVRRVADRVTMLFDGQAACSEPVEDFFAHNIFYRPHTDAFSHRCNTCAGHRPDGRVCEISQQDRCVEPSSSVTSLRSTY